MSNIDEINELVGNEKFLEAKNLLESILDKDTNDIELLKLAGLTYVNLEEWENAKKYFESVVKFEENDATSWYYLASSYDRLGDFISSKNAYLKVINLRPEYVEAYKGLCVVLLKLGLVKEAIDFAQKASELDNDEYLFDFIIGTAYIKLREFEKSIIPFENALKKEPNNIGIYNSLGTACLAIKNSDKALECYKKALEIDNTKPMAFFNIGSIYQVQNNHIEACEYFEKAIELDEEDESFKIAYGMSLLKSEQFEKAADIYKKLLVQHPEKDNYKYNLVTCYEAMGDYQTAIKLLEGIVFVNPKFIPPAQKLANLYIKTNQLAKAKDVYDKILLKNNVTAETFHQYAILSSSLCDTDTAERMLKKVIKMNPNLAKAHKDLGIIYLNKRLFDYAEEEFKEALKLAPNDFEIVFEYGNYLYSVSKNNEAERYYTEALEIEPNNVLALTFMALNKLILNQLDDAKEYIMRSLKINHHHEYILFCAGRIMFARKEYDEAKRYLIKAIELNPDIETQNTLALTYYELGEYQNALNIFENILSKYPDNISVLMSAAKCNEGLNNKEKALDYLYKLTDIFPEDEDAQEMIRKLS